MNRFISAMPSSMCWPFGENSQLKVDGMRSLLNVSAIASRANRPRRFTHGPRLVETVTSGEVVTMRAATSDFSRASSLSSAPKPNCVDMVGWIATGSTFGTSSFGALRRRSPPCAKGTRSRNACSLSLGVARPSNLSHSWPGRMFIAVRTLSICVGVIRPA